MREREIEKERAKRKNNDFASSDPHYDREHWAWILAVKVRQGTLGVDGRGSGPARNTERGYSRLRSGREHWAWILAVEVWQGILGVDGRG